MGSYEGVLKTAARRLGVTLRTYLARRRRGLKPCVFCRDWIPVEKFHRSENRYDRLSPGCSGCQNKSRREVYHKDVKRSRRLARAKDTRRFEARKRYRSRHQV